MVGSSAIEAGRAFLKLLVDDAEFAKGLQGAEAKLNGFGNSLKTIGTKIGLLGGALAAPFAGAIAAFSHVGTEIKEVAERTGMSVKAISELKFAAGQTGIELGSVEKGARGMAKFLAAASGGSEDAAAMLQKLGVSAAELNTLSPDQQFEKLAKAISAVPDPTQRAAAAMAVFGKHGTALLPLMNDFDHLKKRAEELGATMSPEAAEAAKRFHGALDEIKAASTNLAVSIGSELAPALEGIAHKIADATAGLGEFVREHRLLVVGTASVAATMIGVGEAVYGMGEIMKAAVDAVHGLRLALLKLTTNPRIAIFTILGIALAALIARTQWFQDQMKSLELSILGDAEAQEKLAASTKKATDAQDQQVKSVEALALARRNAAEEDAKAAKAKEQLRNEERAAYLNEQIGFVDGDKNNALVKQRDKVMSDYEKSLRMLKGAVAEHKKYPNDVPGSYIYGDLDQRIADFDKADAAREKFNRDLEQARRDREKNQAELRKLEPLNNPSVAEGGNLPGMFGAQMFGMAVSGAMMEMRSRAMGLQEFKTAHYPIPGFGTPDQVTALQQAMGPISTINGRMAGQIFGGDGRTAVEVLKQSLRKHDAMVRKLNDIERKLPGAVGPRFQNGLA